jgi:hypothetical protein
MKCCRFVPLVQNSCFRAAQSVKILIALAVYCTYGLQFYVCLEIAWNGIKNRFTKRPIVAEYVLRTILVILTGKRPNFMFCWTYSISIYACNETNLMHYLSSVYSVTIPLHVLGLLVGHHQEVTMYICNNWYVLYVLVDCWQAWYFSWQQANQACQQSTKTYSTYQLLHVHITTSWWWAASRPETCRGVVTE